MEDTFPPEDRFPRRTWARLLKGQTVTMVAESDGQITGAAIVLLRRTLDIGRLYSLSVAPAARGQGLARRLLLAVESAAAARGCSRMRLEVRASNAPARRLYDGAGYRVISELAGYYPDGETAVRMEKPLTSELKSAS